MRRSKGCTVTSLTYLGALMGQHAVVLLRFTRAARQHLRDAGRHDRRVTQGHDRRLVRGALGQVTESVRGLKQSPNSGEGLIALAAKAEGRPDPRRGGGVRPLPRGQGPRRLDAVVDPATGVRRHPADQRPQPSASCARRPPHRDAGQRDPRGGGRLDGPGRPQERLRQPHPVDRRVPAAGAGHGPRQRARCEPARRAA